MFAVIIAGGKGTRLAERTGGFPKPLVPVNGKPLLAYQLELLARHGFKKVALLCGYGAGAIREFCGDGSHWGLEIACYDEPRPLGTAGAVIFALPHLPEEFFVLYGDTMLDVDLLRMQEAHAASGAAATLFLHPNDHPQDSDLVETDERGRILQFHPYPHAGDACLPNQVNAALYILKASALDGVTLTEKPLDFGKHVFPEMLAAGIALQGYRSPEYIKDAGTPERLDKVSADVASGLVARSGLQQPRGTIFLDRDGTINEEASYIRTPGELRLLPGVAEALRILRGAGFRIAVITNQPVVARGECTIDDLTRIHHRMEMELGHGGAFVDAIYACPHHPHKGYPGEVPELKIDCDCRKPEIGMVKAAALALNSDLENSWFIGDSTVDVQTARNAGIRSILLETGFGGKDGRHEVTADLYFPDLLTAAKYLANRP
ncbi:HAD-IIIA family hydrolase [Silvibacterium acidisoli]|uniref:HAD-IIIA family hydrolase n=1 Tax=Acidobacteriaceae bacterium ZG23-2 TaxID=2883246 RepID=UPI00406BFDAE